MIGELARQEGIKLFSQKYPYLLAALVIAVEAAYMIVTAMKPAETSLDVVTAPQLWAQGLGWGLRFEVYAILVIGGMGISREFSLGTVKTVLILPIRRYQWILAKLLGLVLLSWSLLIVVVGLGLVIAAISPGWGDVLRDGVRLYTAGQVWGNLALASGLTFVFMLPVCAFALLISSFFSSSGAAVGVTLLLGIVLETVTEMLDLGTWLFIHHLYRPFAMIEKLGKGLPFRWGETAAWGSTVALVTFVIFAGLLIFRMGRVDITD